jgi:hypothetical protein
MGSFQNLHREVPHQQNLMRPTKVAQDLQVKRMTLTLTRPFLHRRLDKGNQTWNFQKRRRLGEITLNHLRLKVPLQQVLF